MKQIYILVTITVFLFSTNKSNAQIEWAGTTMTFTKASNADWTLEANQDRITSNVWITRQNNGLIYNILVNLNPDYANPVPFDTEWGIGRISDGVGTLTFDKFLDIVVDSDGDGCPPCGLNVPMVLHLITDDIYIDFMLISWNEETIAPPADAQPGGFGVPGGQFTYQRSTDQSLSTGEFEFDESIKLFPNPSSDVVQVLGSTIINENYKIYNILGAEISNGNISNNKKIDIQNFGNGLYFLKFEKGKTIKFIKE